MHEYAQDAMAYVRTYGRPDLFITFTCNQNWKEIQENLLYNQQPTDRHDIVSRVFNQKQKQLMELIKTSHVFGETVAWLYTIEWQKRGLPHSHNLIWLKHKIMPRQLDNIIKAEIPHETDVVQLREIVMRCMIHKPCGSHNPDSPCMDKDTKKCNKKFPKAFVADTQHGEDGYPVYRRRSPADGGSTGSIGPGNRIQTVDNSWVVPYNALLLKTFNAHINVEYCHSVKSIKYICKYVYKGSDCTEFNLSDEVESFRDGRYISTNEAFHRIFGFRIHNRHPSVLKLAVHLENQQLFYYNPENLRYAAEPQVEHEPDEGSAANAEDEPQPGPSNALAPPPQAHPTRQIAQPTSTLLLCKVDEFAQSQLYCDVGLHYTWKDKKFIRRKNKDIAIGRVYTVHPKETEKFEISLRSF